MKPVQEVFMTLLAFQLGIAWHLFDEVIDEGRQFDHSSENSEVVGSWRSSKLQDSHVAQGILVYMVKKFMHTMEKKVFFLNASKFSFFHQLHEQDHPM